MLRTYHNLQYLKKTTLTITLFFFWVWKKKLFCFATFSYIHSIEAWMPNNVFDTQSTSHFHYSFTGCYKAVTVQQFCRMTQHLFLSHTQLSNFAKWLNFRFPHISQNAKANLINSENGIKWSKCYKKITTLRRGSVYYRILLHLAMPLYIRVTFDIGMYKSIGLSFSAQLKSPFLFCCFANVDALTFPRVGDGEKVLGRKCCSKCIYL